MHCRLPRRTVALLAAITTTACATDAPTSNRQGARRVDSPRPAADVSATVACPPTVPAGYQLVTCFDFTTIPGVWHGFIVGNSLPPIPPGQLSAEYTLVSPTGFERLPPNTFIDVTKAMYTFQSEFNSVTSFDVLRIVSPAGQPPQTFTIIVIKRALTPILEAAGIAPLIAALESSGALNEGEANSLASKLRNAIAKLDEGKTNTAAAMLNAFVNQVSSLISDGVLTPSEGQPLIDAARAVIARLAT